MDDGLQNPALAKDLVIAVVDGRRGMGNNRVIPAGPLRAPLALQLALSDAIVVNAPRAVAASGRACDVAEALRGRFEGPVIETSVEVAGDTSAFSGQPVLALAGIANPARFYDLLEVAGARIVARAEFADHHMPSAAEAREVLARAEAAGARIVTTEKDMARMAGAAGALGELAARAVAVPIQLSFPPREAGRLEALLDAALVTRRRSQVKP
jgi:tetraacyldisaccharide 4'-kinase